MFFCRILDFFALFGNPPRLRTVVCPGLLLLGFYAAGGRPYTPTCPHWVSMVGFAGHACLLRAIRPREKGQTFAARYVDSSSSDWPLAMSARSESAASSVHPPGTPGTQCRVCAGTGCVMCSSTSAVFYEGSVLLARSTIIQLKVPSKIINIKCLCNSLPKPSKLDELRI